MQRAIGSVVLICAVLLGTAARASTSGAMSVLLGWNFGSGTSTYIAQDSRAPGLNTVSPAWWTLRKDGSVADIGDHRYAAWANAHGLRLWPMFSNGFDQKVSHRVMSDPAVRAATISRIRDLARAYGVDGVNLDWEDLATADRDLFNAFVRDAVAEWHAGGLVVSVDVTSRTDAWQLGDWTESVDRSALGSSADYVVLMAYDEHNRLRPNGPTASLPWVTDSVRYLLRSVPASKIVLGVPFYTMDWSDDPARKLETLTIAQTPGRLRAYAASSHWDATLGLTVATYKRGAYVHRVWAEDDRSLGMKAALAGRYGLAGLAAWRLGFETPAEWRALTDAPEPPALPRAAVASVSTVRPAPTIAAVSTPRSPVRAQRPVRPVAAHDPWRLPLIAAALLCLGFAVGATRLRARRRNTS